MGFASPLTPSFQAQGANSAGGLRTASSRQLQWCAVSPEQPWPPPPQCACVQPPARVKGAASAHSSLSQCQNKAVGHRVSPLQSVVLHRPTPPSPLAAQPLYANFCGTRSDQAHVMQSKIPVLLHMNVTHRSCGPLTSSISSGPTSLNPRHSPRFVPVSWLLIAQDGSEIFCKS
eukprot:SAG31_NODE_9515_length_1265_cov_2.314751_1_plen_173_part_10